MSWKDLIQTGDERVVLPWTGGSLVRVGTRTWTLTRRPPAPGWHSFTTSGRRAAWDSASDPDPGVLVEVSTGYLVGDRLVGDQVRVEPTAAGIVAASEPVALIDEGVDRFSRVSAGRLHEGGPLFYRQVEVPLGPEPDVLTAFLDRSPSVAHVKGVTPALEAAFRMESWQRSEAERRRAEAEAQRLAEERRRQLAERLGDGALRREMATQDFPEAARAALAVGGAEFLDSRRGRVREDEMVVTFRLAGRRFECTCDRRTLRVIDSGICLTAHYDDPDFEGGTRGDGFFTLESLPSVVQEAIDTGRLVVYRHVE